MEVIKNNEDSYIPVQEFYAGKSAFITGGTGFLGKVIIEKLLYSCPGINKIYILLRDKNTEDMALRMKKLMDNPIFTRIKNERPEDLDKIIPIGGDLVSPNLGLSPANEHVLINEVSVVFHCAATIKFNEPLKVALAVNVEGTQKILHLCHRMKKLDVFVHVSTTYSNCDQKIIDEIIYPPPMGLNEVYNFVEYHDNDISQSTSILCGLPNTYTFTKALAENLVAQQLGSFKSVIVRPSIVTPSINEPLKGWSDNWYGSTGLLTAIGKGFCRVILSKDDNILDIIPVDYVSNLSIISAAKAYSYERRIVLNVCSSSVNPLRMQEITTMYSKEIVKNGFNDLPFPGVLMTKRKIVVQSVVAVTMVIGYIADMLLRIAGKRPRYVKLLEKLNNMRDSLAYFTSRSWIFKCDNSRFLYNSLNEKDRHAFPCDPKDIDWKLYIPIYVKGVQQYLTKKQI